MPLLFGILSLGGTAALALQGSHLEHWAALGYFTFFGVCCIPRLLHDLNKVHTNA